MSVPRNGFTKALRRLYDWLDTISVNVYSTIPPTVAHAVDDGQQMLVYETLTVDGTLTVNTGGELRVASWPT